MLVTNRRFLQVALMSLGVSFWAAACGSEESGDGDGNNGCTPGETQTCDCPGGDTGVQTCSSDGRAFSQCECGGGGSGNGGAGGGGGNSACGNGALDPGEDCDDMGESADCNDNCTTSECGDGVVNVTAGETCDTKNEFDCPADCGVGGGGGAGGGPVSCSETLVFAGMTPPESSNWDELGQVGLPAGEARCDDLYFGSHVCTYAELTIAESNGEFVSLYAANPANLPDTTTFWLHRTTDVTINNVVSVPGPGGRCNDWTYATNHISDGEYVSFAAGVPTYHFDTNTVFDIDNPQLEKDGNGVKLLPCGGLANPRAIACCYPCEQ
jgi:hypothetical protein